MEKVLFISIIVPIYNVERYLEQCIKSVLVQSYSKWELILVNDGSTDTSGCICDAYAEKDNRIKVIHKLNTGVSDSRNKALDMAKGDYVIFLDADDYWYDATALQQLVDTAEKYNLDIVRGEYKAVDATGKDLFVRKLSDSKNKCAYKIIDSSHFLSDAVCGEFFLVLSLFKRTTLGTLRLNVNRCFLEDMEFYAKLCLQQLSCMYIPIRFYAYRKIQGSASHVPKIKNLEDSFSMCDVFYEYAQQTNDSLLKSYYIYYSVMMYYWTLCTVASKPYSVQAGQFITKLHLKELQRKVNKWRKTDTKNSYSIWVKVAPSVAIFFLKYYQILKDGVYLLRNRCNIQL